MSWRLGIRSVIVRPGAFGTDFGVHSMWEPMPRTWVRHTVHLHKFRCQMAAGMQAMLSAPMPRNPQEVADAVRKLISTPHGQRPARRRRPDKRPGPSAVNQVCEQIEQAMLTGMQMGGMLSVKTHRALNPNIASQRSLS